MLDEKMCDEDEWKIKLKGLEKHEIEKLVETIYNDIIKNRIKNKSIDYVKLSGQFTTQYDLFRRDREAGEYYDKILDEHYEYEQEEQRKIEEKMKRDNTEFSL